MTMEVNGKEIACPASHHFDNIEGHLLKEVMQCASNSEAVTFKLILKTTDGSDLGNMLVHFKT